MGYSQPNQSKWGWIKSVIRNNCNSWVSFSNRAHYVVQLTEAFGLILLLKHPNWIFSSNRIAKRIIHSEVRVAYLMCCQFIQKPVNQTEETLYEWISFQNWNKYSSNRILFRVNWFGMVNSEHPVHDKTTNWKCEGKKKTKSKTKQKFDETAFWEYEPRLTWAQRHMWWFSDCFAIYINFWTWTTLTTTATTAYRRWAIRWISTIII